MARSRAPAQARRDRVQIANLYLQGWLQTEIAKHLGIHQSTVSRDLQTLKEEWAASALADFNEAKQQELARITSLEREYWDAWHRSQSDEVTRSDKQKGQLERVAGTNEKGKVVERVPVESKLIVKKQVGDPRFLQGIEWCIERRCKIMGLDAPLKSEDVTPNAPRFDSGELERAAVAVTEFMGELNKRFRAEDERKKE